MGKSTLKQKKFKVKTLKKASMPDWFVVAPGVWGMKDIFVNVYLVRNPTDNSWVLIDTGLFTTAKKVKTLARQLFWPEIKPAAIVLTHGHFDHTGSLLELADEWQVPVYAHYLEKPYLTGQSAYPPPDPFVGGGLMALLSFLFPKRPVDIGNHLKTFGSGDTIDVLPGWKIIHTPGHSPGHISLFREEDKVLIAGDAIVTTKQESFFSVLTQRKKLSGPPKYFTTNWDQAEASAKKIASLNPDIIASGHGRPMSGFEMLNELKDLTEHFVEDAVPQNGRYVQEPAISDERGVEYVPKPYYPKNLPYVAAGIAAGLIALVVANRIAKRAAN